jgi:hypothetical protein
MVIDPNQSFYPRAWRTGRALLVLNLSESGKCTEGLRALRRQRKNAIGAVGN